MTTITTGPALDTATLARRITHRLPAPHRNDIGDAAVGVAAALLVLGDHVAPGDWLIAGGSLARGEPTFIPLATGEYRLLSDIDLLYVHHSDTPPEVTDLVRAAEKMFTATEVMTMSVHDYRVLGTSLGHDFKNIGVALTNRGVPDHLPVSLDARDAYEILLYYTQAYFWSGLFTQWLADDQPAEFHLALNRTCLKVLRATAMIGGAYNHHDLHMMKPLVAQRMRNELRWRADPRQAPQNPARFWTYLHDALDEFDAAFPQPRQDAVTWTPFAHTPGGRIVTRHHQVVSQLARALADTWHTTRDRAALARVMPSIWAQITGWTGTHPPAGVTSDPEEYFVQHKPEIHDHLLAMKVQVQAG